MPDVILKIAGKKYRGWTSVHIHQSLDAIADSFDLTLTEQWAEGQADIPIKMGSPCDVWIDDTKLITGYVDDVNTTYDSQQHSIQVTGRSKTGDLVHCSNAATRKQFNNRTLLWMAQELAKPFGIAVSSDVAITKQYQTRVIEEGETIAEFLDEMARTQAVMMTATPEGNLLFTRTGKTRIQTPLMLGDNIFSAASTFSALDRFSVYYITGQSFGNDNTNGAAAAHIKGESKDIVMRYRPTVVTESGTMTPGFVNQLAVWKRNRQYGRSKQVRYTVRGWKHDAGLWAKNCLVQIKDNWVGINDWWLISTVDFFLDAKGQRVELTVTPKEAFDVEPFDDKDTWPQ